MRNRIYDFKARTIRLEHNIDVPFSAGAQYEHTFNRFLSKEVESNLRDFEGVTYIIQNDNDIVAYFCVSTNSIPYQYWIENDMEIWGVPVLEIKMFAVNEKYQDTFYEYNGLDMPISAWCLFLVWNTLLKYVSFKALYLHSVPEAIDFYKQNGFRPLNKLMMPLGSIDSDCTPLWMPLTDVVF